MTQEEKDKLIEKIDFHAENLFDVLVPYEKVSGIKDDEFQRLRMDYIESRDVLLRYVGYK
jgi:hypothetical protein